MAGSKKNEKSKAKKEEKQTSDYLESSSSKTNSVTLPNTNISTKEDDKLKEALRDTKVSWILK